MVIHGRATESGASWRFLLVLPLTLGAGFAPAPASDWIRKPSDEQRRQIPGLVHETFDSAAMNTAVGYSVVLPPGYDTGKKRYPVVYWLHGGGGNECSSLFTSQSWERLCRAGLVDEVLLVYPNGFRSGYMDHHDGKIRVETMIIRELIPRIDRRYRTLASRAGRAIHGFSMGASGSLKFAIKYPELFCAAVAYGGGAIDLERSESRFILDILKRNLNSDPDLIRQNNTYHFLEKNHAAVRTNAIRFLLVCGDDDSWEESAITFFSALQAKAIPSRRLSVPDTGHDLRGLTRAAGAAALFQDRAFRRAQGRSRPWSSTEPSTFTETYYSPAEDTGERFQVTLPPGYSTEKKYPLFVQVFGARSMLPTSERPFIRVRPSGRGVWGYRSMSRYDVMQIIDHMRLLYELDADRVYMTGTSSGATGIMHVAAQRPDVFAGVVPLVAFGNDLPLENFRNLPIRCEHGVNDWTSSIGNVRVQFQKLARLGYDAKLHEHPSAGHGIRTPPPATLDWLFRLRRDSSPQHVVYSCEHPRDGGAYWLRIRTFDDPHAVARVDARIEADTVTVNPQNIKRFSLDLSNAAFRNVRRLRVDGAVIDLKRGRDHRRQTFVREDRWLPETARRTRRERRAYGAGAAANLFQGEPLVVVHGTGSHEAENAFLRRAADVLARSGGPDFKPASVQFPVTRDSRLEDPRWRDFNLLLVGTTRNHSFLREIADRLPYAVKNGRLLAGGREPLDLRGAVLSFHYFNPANPSRLVYIVSPYLSEDERSRFLRDPRKFLAGAHGFKMIDQPDLLVRGMDLRIRREMQLGADWNFIRPDGQERRVPARFSDRAHFARAHLKVMRRTAETDFAFWWGPEDKGLFGGYDFNWLPTLDGASYTLADFAVRRRETQTMTASLSAAELKEIFDRWVSTAELLTWPPVKAEDIGADRTYRIVIPMDLVPKLGGRRKVLRDVAPGPEVLPRQIAAEVFAEE